MDAKGLAEFIEARICDPCKHGYTCDDFGCGQAKQIAGILRRIEPFKGKDSEGNDVSGWLIPE